MEPDAETMEDEPKQQRRDQIAYSKKLVHIALYFFNYSSAIASHLFAGDGPKLHPGADVCFLYRCILGAQAGRRAPCALNQRRRIAAVVVDCFGFSAGRCHIPRVYPVSPIREE